MIRHRPEPHRGDEDGFTLLEITVTTALLLVVLAILMPLLTGTMTTFQRQTDRSSALDMEGVALQQIEHDVFASSVVNVAGSGTSASPNALQLITNLSSTPTCVEYLIVYQSTTTLPVALKRESWTLGSTPPATSTWQTMLSPLVLNGTGQPHGYVIPNPVGVAPFSSAGSNGQSVNVTLQVQSGTSSIVQLATTATGVNANSTGSSTAAAAWAAQC